MMCYLHTGESLGVIGQALAGRASFGALFLVWTGFELAWRPFFGGQSNPSTETSETSTAAANKTPTKPVHK
jgi:hypothetical protein